MENAVCAKRLKSCLKIAVILGLSGIFLNMKEMVLVKAVWEKFEDG